MTDLKVLSPAARALVTPAFRHGDAGVDVSKHQREFHRSVPLAPLRRMIEEAMHRFNAARPELSDGWLAPRVHATLRLTRREASEQGAWTYLAIVEFPDYVRWRYKNKTQERFIGSDMNQALSRLWWGAELTRNGEDYSLVAPAFEFQDIPNTWFRLRAFHHRPTALAAISIMSEFAGGIIRNGKRIKRTDRMNYLSTALNTALTTAVLDAVAPYGGEDAGAIAEWLSGEVDETLMLEQPPVGPAEERVSRASVEAVEALVRRIGEQAGLLGGPEYADSDEIEAANETTAE